MAVDVSLKPKHRQVVSLTCAMGGKANLSDNGGVACERSSRSSCEYPSFSNMGRLYCATKVSILYQEC